MFELNPLKLVNIFFIPVSLHQAEDMTLLRLPVFFILKLLKMINENDVCTSPH